MKRIALFLPFFALGLVAASLATANPPPGNGNQSTVTAPTCRPMISVILKGTFASASADSFSMNVTHANRHGKLLLGAQTLSVDDRTKYRRNGRAKLGDFLAGDRLYVEARACKAGASANPSAPAILAKRVVGHPAASATTTTSSTTTTTP